MRRRVVVTGAGVVSALGCSVSAAFERLKKPVNCVERSEELAGYKGLQSVLCAPARFARPPEYTRKVVRTMRPVSIMALNATEQALRQAGLENDPVLSSGRAGVAYGSCYGGIEANADFMAVIVDREIRNVTSSTYVKMMPQTCAVNLSVHFGITGRLLPANVACASGSLAIGEAFEAVAWGAQDVMLAGGAEEFSVTQVAVFDTLFATSRRNAEPELTPRPFDRNRDGLVIGDGAGTLVLEERGRALARGATVLAEITGFATNSDGRHVTQPNPGTQAECMRLALESASLSPDGVGYVNAHGTGTKLGDAAEGAALSEVFGGVRPPVSTIKGYTGHTLGACGAIEAALTIEMMRNGWFAPNLNLDDPDPACGDHDFIVGSGRAFGAETAMSNNFAFGGVNTSLVFRLP